MPENIYRNSLCNAPEMRTLWGCGLLKEAIPLWIYLCLGFLAWTLTLGLVCQTIPTNDTAVPYGAVAGGTVATV